MTDNHTDYTYQVKIRIDSGTGELAVFLFGGESGEIGKPIYGGTDRDIAHSVGVALIEDARRSEHGWEPGEMLVKCMTENYHKADV